MSRAWSVLHVPAAMGVRCGKNRFVHFQRVYFQSTVLPLKCTQMVKDGSFGQLEESGARRRSFFVLLLDKDCFLVPDGKLLTLVYCFNNICDI